MGDYFKEETKTEKKEEELITDFDSLCAAYNSLVSKIDETTSQGYEAILPIRTELSGGGKTPEDIGQIGTLRRRIERSRIYRMDLGIMMWNALKNIEDLDRWSERYGEYLEKHIDGLKLISRSGFKIITNRDNDINELRKEVNDLNNEMHKLKNQLVAQTEPVQTKPRPSKPVEIKKEPPPSRTTSEIKKERIERIEKEKFEKLLKERLAAYEKMQEVGDEKAIQFAKKLLFDLAGEDLEKKKLIEKEIEELSLITVRGKGGRRKIKQNK